MNERIRELIEQATEKIANDGKDLWLGKTHYRLVFNKEKFAELIVRECINEIHVADVGDLKGKGYYLDKVAEHIEKHFGVEE